MRTLAEHGVDRNALWNFHGSFLYQHYVGWAHTCILLLLPRRSLLVLSGASHFLYAAPGSLSLHPQARARRGRATMGFSFTDTMSTWAPHACFSLPCYRNHADPPLTGSCLKKMREERVRRNHRRFHDFQPNPEEGREASYKGGKKISYYLASSGWMDARPNPDRIEMLPASGQATDQWMR